MAHKNKTDEWLEKYAAGEVTASGIRPWRPKHALHKYKGTGSDAKDAWGLVEFPVKVLLYMLRELFTDFDEDRFKWSENEKQTQIYIMDKYPQAMEGEQEKTEIKPAVLTDRGNITRRYVNGRQSNRRFAADDSMVMFSDLLQVPMTLHCLAENGTEAEYLAGAVFMMLSVDEETLKLRGGYSITNLSIGTEGPMLIDTGQRLTDVPVSFQMEYGWSWARKPDGTMLTRLGSLKIDANNS